jgi:hypothetical protein
MIAALVALALAQTSGPGPQASPTPPVPAPTLERGAVQDGPVSRDEFEDLKDEVKELRGLLAAARQREEWTSRFKVSFSSYLDFGFFWVQGNGSGVRPDYQRQVAPELNGQIPSSWVLVGDPLSTAINSRGDVADIGDSRAIRADPVHAGGRPSFLVNALGVAVDASFDDALSLIAALDFLPRQHDITTVHGLGDLVDLKLAFARYTKQFKWLSLQVDAGKVESLLGIEYRTQDAPNRLTVTPSLLCRYTCGRPLGVRAAARFLDEQLEIALALTNGTQQVDYFPFTDQVDSNRWKTIGGRLAYRVPVGRGLEIQVNGAIGPQDRQPDDSVLQWHAGAAAQLEVWRLLFVAEAVMGSAQGKADVQHGLLVFCGLAPCLDYRSAYGLVGLRLFDALTPYARFDFRSARHRSGDDFAYISDVARLTVGLNVAIGSHVIVKAEYVLNQELAAVHFPDDVFTSSLVVRY